MIEFPYFGTIKRGTTSPFNWYLLDDASHISKGIGQVETFDTHVRVYPDCDAVAVGVAACTPDEAFILPPQFFVGPSPAIDYVDVYFSIAGGSGYANPRNLSRAGANVWIQGVAWIEDPPEA